MDSSEEYRKACLKRYYQNMVIRRAMYLHSIFAKESKKKAITFAKRINFAKGYNVLKV